MLDKSYNVSCTEISQRSVLHQLRHCEPQPGVLWGGLVMTTGDVTRAYRVSVR